MFVRPTRYSLLLDHSLKVQLVHVTGTSAETANERAIALLEMIDQRHDELLERIDELSNRIDQVLAEFSPKKPAVTGSSSSATSPNASTTSAGAEAASNVASDDDPE